MTPINYDTDPARLLRPRQAAPVPFALEAALKRLAGQGWMSRPLILDLHKTSTALSKVTLFLEPVAAGPAQLVAQLVFSPALQLEAVLEGEAPKTSLATEAARQADIELTWAACIACRWLHDNARLPARLRMDTREVDHATARLLGYPWPATRFIVQIIENPFDPHTGGNIVLISEEYTVLGAYHHRSPI